ncbi:MAG: two-component system, OmpR family, sensor kinase, partial [Pseudonocardiales bacterium]|nr:two-component system, OmpR family, sensor kinase [Pseudonocardiales bacterium]
MSRGSLAARISLVTVAVAVMTAVVAGALSIGLIRSSDESSARDTLARIATATATTADTAVGTGGELRARRTLNALSVQYATFGPGGRVNADTSDLAAVALSRAEMVTVARGATVSDTRTVNGQRVLVEARPAGNGGFVLVQRQSDALAGLSRAVRRILLGLLLGAAIAAVAGVLFARRLAGPLRRTALAAHALAFGRRDVLVRPDGPAEVAEVAEAVNRLAASLTSSEARQRNFLMSVSHELRTPLTAITGYAESLAGGVVPPEETARVGSVMYEEANRLSRLVSDLLDLARLDAADFRIDLVDGDLAALARAAAQVWTARCVAAGVEFRLEATGPVPARFDPVRLRQAVDGLLENALRVTPAGAPI